MLPLSTSSRYHHGDLRAALLAATGDLLVESGVEALSLREVSRRAGVSHAAAYNHFRDKAALLRAFVAAAFTAFAADLRTARDAASDPLDSLVEIGVAYVLFAYRHPAQFRLMFRPELVGPIADDPGEEAIRGSYAVLVEAIARARAAGAIAGDPDALVLAAWSTVHGLSAIIVDGPDSGLGQDEREVERLARSTLAVLAAGLVPADRKVPTGASLESRMLRS
jgi:AcrR family transcriptional regulator